MSKALGGLVVLDTATEFWASLAAAMLGDFGASVIKVEPSDSRAAPEAGAWDQLFELANRNKRSLAIDFEQPGGRAAFE